MTQISDSSLLWFAVAVQMLGVLSVVATRLTERSWAVLLSQRLFFVCLLAVGATAIAAICLRNGTWLACGITLGVMAVGATLDCRPTRHLPAY